MEVRTNTTTTPSIAVEQVKPHVDSVNDKTETMMEDSHSALTEDARSSSLSDLDDDDEPASNNRLEFNKSVPRAQMPDQPSFEAETERLEISPQKAEPYGDAILETSPKPFEPNSSKLARATTLDVIHEDLENPNDDKSEAIDNATQKLPDKRSTVKEELEKQADEELKTPLPPAALAGLKRKHLDEKEDKGDVNSDEPARKRTGSVKSETEDVNGVVTMKDVEPVTKEEVDEVSSEQLMPGTPVNADVMEEDAAFDDQITTPSPSKSNRSRRGKRRGKKTRDPALMESSVKESTEQGDVTDQIAETNTGEDDDTNTAVEDAEAVAREEAEAKRKKSAMDSLMSIEKQFAVFREKLYDDRLGQIEKELGQLDSSNPTHPEYLAMIQCLDDRRDKKIQYEKTLLHYKAKALKNKSIATRAHIHSQYYQDVRKIREQSLDDIGEMWYSIHRDRSNDRTVEFGYKFPIRRSEQIRQQTAYNQEVSILSGVAKYIGFPGAPELAGVTKSELEDDYEKMGIPLVAPSAPTQYRTLAPTHLQQLRPYNAALALGLNHKSIDDQYFEQTPWPSAQHSLHYPPQQFQQYGLGQNAPAVGGPFLTPSTQRRIPDLPTTQGSASTTDLTSGPNSAAAAAAAESSMIPDDRLSPTLLRRHTTASEPPAGVQLSRKEIDSLDSRDIPRSETGSPVDKRNGHILNNRLITSTQSPSSHPYQPRTVFSSNSYQSPAPRTGIFSSPALKDGASRSSAKQTDDIVVNPRPAPAQSLQYFHGITAGSGLGRFAAR